MKSVLCVAAIAAVSGAASASMGQIRITEWSYQGGGGEFIEIANVGGSAIDLTGWSYDDDSRLAGTVDLSLFGLMQPGDVAIITDLPEVDFRAEWSLSASVKVLGDNLTNLGRNDEINIFDASSNLVDRLTYGDQNIPGTIRTNIATGITTSANWGTNNVAAWFLSASGDAYGTYTSLNGGIGNPGIIPTPGALALLGLGGLIAGRRRR